MYIIISRNTLEIKLYKIQFAKCLSNIDFVSIYTYIHIIFYESSEK